MSLQHTLQFAPDVFQRLSSTNEKLMLGSLMQPGETVHQHTVCVIPFDTSVISLKIEASMNKSSQHFPLLGPEIKLLATGT